jgi:hypothetical protein
MAVQTSLGRLFFCGHSDDVTEEFETVAHGMHLGFTDLPREIPHRNLRNL